MDRVAEETLAQRDEKESSSTEKIMGKVIDAETGEPLTGVKIMINNKEIGTTNPTGIFAIPAMIGKDTLTFQFSGYKTAQVPVGRYTVRADVALQKEGSAPLQELESDQYSLFIINGRTALLGRPSKVLYDIGHENIMSMKIVTGDEKKVWIDKFGNFPKEHKFDEVVLIKTEKGLEREILDKKQFDKIPTQLNKVKVISEVPKSASDSLRIRITENKSYSQPDTSENILYIIDGVALKDNAQKVLGKIDPSDIKSIEVFKNNSESFNNIVHAYMKGAKQVYDGIIMIKTKGENSPDLSNMEDQRFENKLIVFPSPSDDQLSVQFELEEAAHVRIEVIDMNGQSVALLVDQVYNSGIHQVAWDGAEKKSGWYMIKVTKEDQAFTRKVVLE